MSPKGMVFPCMLFFFSIHFYLWGFYNNIQPNYKHGRHHVRSLSFLPKDPVWNSIGPSLTPGTLINTDTLAVLDGPSSFVLMEIIYYVTKLLNTDLKITGCCHSVTFTSSKAI